MSVNLTIQANKSAFIVSSNKNANFSQDTVNRAWRDTDCICIGFNDVPSEYKYRKIENLDIYVYCKNHYKEKEIVIDGIRQDQTYPVSIELGAFTGDWGESIITYRNAPECYDTTPNVYVNGEDRIETFSGEMFYAESSSQYADPTRTERYGKCSADWLLEMEEQYPTDGLYLLKRLNLFKYAIRYGVKTVVYSWHVGQGLSSGDYPYSWQIWPDNIDVYTTRSEYPPYMALTLADENVTLNINSVSPASGYVPKTIANTFSWSAQQSDITPEDLTIADAKIEWKSTETGTVHTINCGAVSSYTVPANTFDSDEVYWRVKITDSADSAVYSSWSLLSTQEELSTSEAISPKNVNVDGAVENTFEWTHNIGTGTNATRSELQLSQNRISWSTLKNITGDSLSTVISPNTLPSGTVFWRVRTYNADDDPGDWSDPVVINVVSPPVTPSVSATQTPRPVITWQSIYQQGFQVKIDDVYNSGIIYGEGKQLKLPLILSDGSYTVSVRIVNAIGLWSDWGTAPINVNNVTGTPIILTTASERGVVDLSWYEALEENELSTYDGFIVYRDNSPIVKLRKEYSYCDIFTSGEHVYQIRGIYDDSDNYGISNISREDVNVNNPLIIDVEGRTLLALKYTTTSLAETSISKSRNNSKMHVYGSAYPVIEISEFENKTFSFTTAFLHDSDDALSFEKLFGKIVCVKCKGREAVTGILDVVSKRISLFYINYTCNLTQIQYEEEVEL